LHDLSLFHGLALGNPLVGSADNISELDTIDLDVLDEVVCKVLRCLGISRFASLEEIFPPIFVSIDNSVDFTSLLVPETSALFVDGSLFGSDSLEFGTVSSDAILGQDLLLEGLGEVLSSLEDTELFHATEPVASAVATLRRKARGRVDALVVVPIGRVRGDALEPLIDPDSTVRGADVSLDILPTSALFGPWLKVGPPALKLSDELSDFLGGLVFTFIVCLRSAFLLQSSDFLDVFFDLGDHFVGDIGGEGHCGEGSGGEESLHSD
jgi:hypothetical protein